MFLFVLYFVAVRIFFFFSAGLFVLSYYVFLLYVVFFSAWKYAIFFFLSRMLQ